MDYHKRKKKLNQLNKEIIDCDACNLCQTRTNAVWGSGDINKKLMIVGEAPGFEEDKSGNPFVGTAGKFLFEVFSEKGLLRKHFFITNMVKCIPLSDDGDDFRKPLKNEINTCKHYLLEQIDIIKPKLIITLGNVATQNFIPIKQGITKIHGEVYYYEDIPVIPMYHPSFIKRNGGHHSKFKRHMLEDLNTAIKLLKSMRK